MENTEIANTLGRIEGGITSAKEEMQRFREENIRQTDDAARGRQRIYQSINDFKDSVTKELSEVKSKQQLLDMRVEDLRNVMSVVQPSAAEIPIIRIAIADLKTGHEKIDQSVKALEAIKLQIQGGLTISKIWGSALWALIIAISAGAGAVASALWHYFVNAPIPPGR